ncbi:MAG: PspC domain-containing protein [Leptothrix sp. (in: b-proteobacteria)]
MSLADELAKLDALRERGVLSAHEFDAAKRRLLGDALGGSPAPFRRERDDRWIAGVCGGLARLTGAESWVWRLAFAFLFLFAGTGVLLYLLLWVFVPQAPDAVSGPGRLPQP